MGKELDLRRTLELLADVLGRLNVDLDEAVEAFTDGCDRAKAREILERQHHDDFIERVLEILTYLLGTIRANIERTSTTGGRFERTVMSNREVTEEVSLKFEKHLKKKGQLFLEELDEWLLAHEDVSDSDAPVFKVGAGLYFFQQDDWSSLLAEPFREDSLAAGIMVGRFLDMTLRDSGKPIAPVR